MKRENLKNWLLTIGLLIALGGVAGAGGKAIDWIQVSTTRASNPCQAGKACKYVNSSDGKWHSVSTAGTDTVDGSGGSGTLATSYSTGTVSADQTMAIAGANGGAPILRFNGLGGSPTGAVAGLFLDNATAATSGVPQQFSPMLALQGRSWNGSSSLLQGWGLTTRAINGGSSTGHLGFYQLENGGSYTLRATMQPSSNDGFALFDSGGAARLSLSTNAGAVFGYSGATFSAGSGSVTMGDGTGSLGMSAGNLTMTIIQGVPDADGTRDWGLVGTRWRIVAGKVVSAQHPAGNGTAPTKAAGACLGGTQTVTLDANATDASGTITLGSTATGTAASTCATVTFNATWATAPHCQITAANQAASALSGAAQLWIDSASTTTSVFVIKSNTALVAGTYIYNYDCYQ
jgi:hypothetical protein